MEWLNYHHLLYFWMVVREGGLVPAAKALHLSHGTISTQIKQLEDSLGEQLFDRSRRRLELTEVGKVAYEYAEEIFGLGRELMDTIKGRPTGRPVRLVVGVTEVTPKLVVRRLLDPAFSLGYPIQLICEESRHDRLLASLATHRLDVVLADAPVPPGSSIKAFNHLLGECGITFCAAPALAKQVRRNFPRSLDGQPFLMPTDATTLHRSLEQWFEAEGIRPRVVAEFEDSALLNVFGQDGFGVFASPDVVETDVIKQYGVQVVGRNPAIKESFYAISVERRLKNPAVVAISALAREKLFA